MPSHRILLTIIIVLLIASCTVEEETNPTAVEATEPVAGETATRTAPPASPTSAATSTAETDGGARATEVTPAVAMEAPTATAEATMEEPEEATAEPVVAVNGRTEDGAYFLGRADAPVRMIDYSDFM